MKQEVNPKDTNRAFAFEMWMKSPMPVLTFTKTNGIDVIEAVERTDKPFFIGIQYHPEVAVSKHVSGATDASRFMDYEAALCYFRALVKQGSGRR